MAVGWWYRVGTEIIGPVSESQIAKLARTGELRPETPLRRDKYAPWVRADSLQGLVFGAPADAGQKESSAARPAFEGSRLVSDSSIDELLHQLASGDHRARAELITRSMTRLERLARKMLHENPAVRRWEQTDDLLQNALVRLDRALAKLTPDSPRRFIGLAATQIRRELIDLYRHHYGPQGAARHHDTSPDFVGVERGLDPAEQFALHEAVGSLDDPLREVFEMTYYEGMTQVEIAAVVGVSERTVKRRWREARQRLRRALRDDSEAGRGTAGDWRAGI